MTEHEISYTTTEQQIEKLISQGLIIRDKEYAKKCLSSFGYSNLIKSYREPYMITVDGRKVFRSGITFEQLCSLYILDKNLRNAVIASMLDLEEHIKEAAADVIAKAFGIHQDEYIQYRHYQNKRKHIPRFTLSAILRKLTDTLDTDKDPIHHYNTEHGIVPPWILFKSIYFSTIINFIDQFKRDEQIALVDRLYDTKKLKAEPTDLALLMMDTLFVCLDYRNMSAHGARIYNHSCGRSIRYTPITIPSHGFSMLLCLLSFFNYQSPYNSLSEALNREINRHCKQFPSDVTYLSTILNVNISEESVVWISKRSNIFHANRHCSGLINAQRIDYEKALEQGYQPCYRCCK